MSFLQSGIITSLPTKEKNVSIYDVLLADGSKTKLHVSYFLPLDLYDSFTGQIDLFKHPYTNEKHIEFAAKPWIVMTTDRHEVIKFIEESPMKYKKGNRNLLRSLEYQYQQSGSTSFVSFINEIASDFFTHQFFPHMLTHVNVTKQLVVDFLQFWRRRRWYRALYLLGLSNADIRASDWDPLTLHKKLIHQPYFVYTLSLDKADQIIKQQHQLVDYHSIERKVGIFLRFLYECRTNRAWSCVKLTKRLQEQYPSSIPEIKANPDRYPVTVVQINTNTYFYLQKVYGTERAMSEQLVNIHLHGKPYPYKPELLKQMDRVYVDEQRKAIQGVLEHPLSLLIGHPGAGKTTVIAAVVHQLQHQKASFHLSAFTGKAVSRMKEVISDLEKQNENEDDDDTTKVTPMTLDMMLVKKSFITDFDVLIIDEASMISIDLLHRVLSTFSCVKHLILVGDVQQLPCIQWGDLLSVLMSKDIPCFELIQNHRIECKNKALALNAAQMSKPVGPYELVEDRTFIREIGSLDKVEDILLFLSQRKKDPYQIKIITPFNQYIEQINLMVRSVFEFDQRSCTQDANGKTWYEGEKVMMTKNNYEKMIMNGDEGIISSCSDKHIMVRFGDRDIKFPFTSSAKKSEPQDIDEMEAELHDELSTNHLTLSTAITVHKSQGSEYPLVIFFLPKSSAQSFLTKNLVYTAMTRSRKCVIVVEEERGMLESCLQSRPSIKQQLFSHQLTSCGMFDNETISSFSGDHDVDEDVSCGYDSDDDY